LEAPAAYHDLSETITLLFAQRNSQTNIAKKSRAKCTQRCNYCSATADGARHCGQLPGTCNAAVPWNTRHVSLYTNKENALLRSSSNTFCTHPAKIDAQFTPCWVTIAWSQASLNHGQSFFWPAERPTLMRARRSSTSKRFFALAPPCIMTACTQCLQGVSCDGMPGSSHAFHFLYGSFSSF
jgi:hypothetical protein